MKRFALASAALLLASCANEQVKAKEKEAADAEQQLADMKKYEASLAGELRDLVAKRDEAVRRREPPPTATTRSPRRPGTSPRKASGPRR